MSAYILNPGGEGGPFEEFDAQVARRRENGGVDETGMAKTTSAFEWKAVDSRPRRELQRELSANIFQNTPAVAETDFQREVSRGEKDLFQESSEARAGVHTASIPIYHPGIIPLNQI